MNPLTFPGIIGSGTARAGIASLGRPMKDTTIETLRTAIDRIDRELVDLLNQRMIASLQIGEIKSASNRDILDTAREEEVLRRVAEANAGPLPQETLRAVYREILSGSRALQSRVSVAYLGPIGTNTHHAAQGKFGAAASYVPVSTIGEVFDEVGRDAVTFGVVPVENSIDGSIRETMDCLMTLRVGVCGEICLRVSHALMSLSGDLAEVRRVVSHPQALAQCRGWLRAHLPGIRLEECTSTAAAAEIAVSDLSVAAIANASLAEPAGLRLISRAIEDRADNMTRFLILGRSKPAPSGNDKTSIIFWTEDRPGALYGVLERFAAHTINLCRIESRPNKGVVPWKYAFFVDLEGHRDDPAVAACLEEIASSETTVKVLGSFPVHQVPMVE